MKVIKHLVFFILLLVTTAAFAQPGRKQPNAQQKEKIKALKIGLITDNLELTPAESEKFWPIYNKYEADKRSLGYKPAKDKIDSMSDQELNQLLEAQLNKQEQVLALKRQLIEDLRPVLPLKKIVKLNFVERKFKRELLQRIRRKKGRKKREKEGKRSNF